jgi:TIR domain/AAA ATPase domain
MPKVFISYSHDSPEHSARVLDLANALRAHGVDAELDQYHVRPERGWPHWCAEQLREKNPEFVLLVCTETYRRRVENKVAADEGRGVYWEGAIIYDYLYEAKGNRRFIPILWDGAPADAIPQPIRNHTRYSIAAFNLDDAGYQKLYRELTQQPAVVKPPLGKTIALGPASPILSALPVREVKTHFVSPVATVRVFLEKLPQSGPNFLGREAELKLLDEAWADGGRTHVVLLVAPGGVGKTTLVKRWLDRLRADGWRRAGCVYGWSFFSQGTSDDRQASDDAFLNDTLRWFGVEHDPTLSPWDKGRLHRPWPYSTRPRRPRAAPASAGAARWTVAGARRAGALASARRARPAGSLRRHHPRGGWRPRGIRAQ